jgi:subtilisin
MMASLEAFRQPITATGNNSGEVPASTWGLIHTGVVNTEYTGQGIKVAILDTGLNCHCPDFQNRHIVSRSFVKNETAHDGNGHGTHCTGIALGPGKPLKGPRYGVASGASIYVAKVLPDAGMANTRFVLEGIEWALDNQCRVISISLGNRVRFGETHSTSFERLGQQALASGSLVIASAGNDSYRDIDRLLPVSHPANCPSFLTVGAVDEQYKMYNRCNRTLNHGGGKVDLVAPGVGIHSAWTGSENYRTLDGTSMATSFVVGIAALWIEAFPEINVIELKNKLLAAASAIELPKEDVGAGLVQAPAQRLETYEFEVERHLVKHRRAT